MKNDTKQCRHRREKRKNDRIKIHTRISIAFLLVNFNMFQREILFHALVFFNYTQIEQHREMHSVLFLFFLVFFSILQLDRLAKKKESYNFFLYIYDNANTLFSTLTVCVIICLKALRLMFTISCFTCSLKNKREIRLFIC